MVGDTKHDAAMLMGVIQDKPAILCFDTLKVTNHTRI